MIGSYPDTLSGLGNAGIACWRRPRCRESIPGQASARYAARMAKESRASEGRAGQSAGGKGGIAEGALREFVQAIVRDEAAALGLLGASPGLARAYFERGATREGADVYFLEAIACYVYAGDTALHVAAAAYRTAIARQLLKLGADVHARNRRGASPLHSAVRGEPGSASWAPDAQVAMVTLLIGAGADPNAVDKGGVTPLHRAVRHRCAAAVRALLEGGADASRKNKGGSTALMLALHNTGRGGTGSAAAKAEQSEILRLLDPAR
jgi:hypothetical protein